MEQAGQKRIRRIAAVLVVIMGLALIQDRVRLLWAGHDSLNWPTVSGTVVDAKAAPIAGARTGGGWQVRVEYRYELDGQVYFSDRMFYTRRLGGRTEQMARDELVHYVPGGSVLVHYHPDWPARAVLNPGADTRAFFGLVVGIGLLAIGVTFWVVPTRSARKRRPVRDTR